MNSDNLLYRAEIRRRHQSSTQTITYDIRLWRGVEGTVPEMKEESITWTRRAGETESFFAERARREARDLATNRLLAWAGEEWETVSTFSTPNY